MRIRCPVSEMVRLILQVERGKKQYQSHRRRRGPNGGSGSHSEERKSIENYQGTRIKREASGIDGHRKGSYDMVSEDHRQDNGVLGVELEPNLSEWRPASNGTRSPLTQQIELSVR